MEDLEYYRMLEMTRDYAQGKLLESGEARIVACRHAVLTIEILKLARDTWAAGDTSKWLAVFGPRVGDLRRALIWAFSPQGDDVLAIQLSSLSSVLFSPLGLMEEYKRYIELAIAASRKSDARDPAVMARLYAALGAIRYYTEGHLNDSAVEAFDTALSCATEIGDVGYQLRALCGLSAVHLIRGKHEASLQIAQAFRKLPDKGENHAAYRTLVHSHHYCGNVTETGHFLEAALGSSGRNPSIDNMGAEYDQRQVTLRCTQAVHQWFSGDAEQAMETVRLGIDDAMSYGHSISLTSMLARAACPLALVIGGIAAAEPYVKLLKETAKNHSMLMWLQWATAYEAAMAKPHVFDRLEAKRVLGQPVTGLQLEYLAILGDDFTKPWIINDALQSSSGWCRAELLRAQGEIVLRDKNDRWSAEELFRRALLTAKERGNLAWTLRAATSLARYLGVGNGGDEGKDILSDALSKFREDLHCREILLAKKVLADL